jgi:hypothetical protein
VSRRADLDREHDTTRHPKTEAAGCETRRAASVAS